MISNSEVKRAAGQIFAYGNQYESPFYNRERSRKELLEKAKTFSAGEVFIISEPLGTGKTFFIDSFGKELGLIAKQKPIFVQEITPDLLKTQKQDFLFIDEADIKTPWSKLQSGLECLAGFIHNSGQKAVLIGDYSLRNPELTGCFQQESRMETFEPLDQSFLHGVIKTRLKRYLKKRDSIIEQELMDLILPVGMSPAASFRTLLTMFSSLVRSLPTNNESCQLTLELARKWSEEAIPELNTDRQEKFLNLFLDYLNEYHPNGEGLGQGLEMDKLYAIASKISPEFRTVEEFEEEIIDPFTRMELFIAMGVPYLNKNGKFIRRPEPFLPSVQLLLLA
jgi:hypothetical protein